MAASSLRKNHRDKTPETSILHLPGAVPVRHVVVVAVGDGVHVRQRRGDVHVELVLVRVVVALPSRVLLQCG